MIGHASILDVVKRFGSVYIFSLIVGLRSSGLRVTQLALNGRYVLGIVGRRIGIARCRVHGRSSVLRIMR